jgi:hypothetical protein
MATLLLSEHHIRQRCSKSGLLLETSLISLMDQRFLPCGRRLSSPFVCHCRARAAFLLVLQAGKSGLTLLLPCSLLGEADLEAAAAKPKEDSLGCRHLSCKSSAFATSSLLVKKAVMSCSLLVE